MKIIIPNKPIALKRHRHTKDGRTYNSQRVFMDEISFIVKSQWNKKPYNVPLRLFITFFMPIPKSKKKELHDTFHFKRPDISNLLKFYEDALNGVLWEDDCLIVEVHASKVYSKDPRTEIVVKPIKE